MQTVYQLTVLLVAQHSGKFSHCLLQCAQILVGFSMHQILAKLCSQLFGYADAFLQQQSLQS